MNFIRAYLRASTQEQDANRARDALDRFATGHGGVIASYYVENESGASLDRPELFRLLNDCRPGDVLLIEQVDRLSRLTTPDWEILRAEIKSRRVRVVALDLPTSWGALKANLDSDDFTSRMFEAINSMLLDMLAAVARKDYEDRRRRQAQGVAKAKIDGRYKGRPINNERNNDIIRLLKKKERWQEIMRISGCSSSHISKLKRQINDGRIKEA